jgi:hypothetical protein
MKNSMDAAPKLPDAVPMDGLPLTTRLTPRPRYEGRKEFGLYVVIDHGPIGDSIPRVILQVSFGDGHPDPASFVREEAHRLNTGHYLKDKESGSGEAADNENRGGVVTQFSKGQGDD